MIELNPDALDIAEQLDRELAESGPRGPLHGVPVVIKDNIDTSDRMSTTAGSLALEGSIPKRDSTVVTKLRAAGAVILGKANLSEWANFRSTRSSSGWSARGGQCRNPYVLDRNPCGSSSGSAVTVSANLCLVAVGTETDGSIVCPSSANGIVGVKPTVGLVSRRGIIPIAHSQDTAGPMARSVRDAAILLSVLAGRDREDTATAPAADQVKERYEDFLDPDGLRGTRLGIARQFMGFHPEVDRWMEKSIEIMTRAGAEITDPANIPTRGQLGGPEFEILLFEFKTDLNAYLGSLDSAPVSSLKDVIAFNEKNRTSEMPYFGQDIFLLAEQKGSLSSPEYRDALEKAKRLSRAEGLDFVLDSNSLDAIVAPTGGPAWATDLVHGDRSSGGSSTPAAVAGYPNITVPMGHIHGLPVGISFFGRAWSEPDLLRIAYAFEQATRTRQKPEFLPTLPV
jgi:amidase